MLEKVITLYDTKIKKIAGIIIVQDIGLFYIDQRIVAYAKKGLGALILTATRSFEQRCVNIPAYCKRIAEWLKTGKEWENIVLLEPFMLASDNKNKSSRNKRMIESLNLPYKLERSCIIYGTKNT